MRRFLAGCVSDESRHRPRLRGTAIRTTPERCDYLFVGEDEDNDWVVTLELKSGRFKAADAARQLQGGADLADSWLPWNSSFRFVPVLAHGRTVPKEEQKALRRHSNRVRLRGKMKQIELIRCGTSLAAATR